MPAYVVISPGFGAGWSTWADTDNEAVVAAYLTDPALMADLLAGVDPSDACDAFAARFALAFPEEDEVNPPIFPGRLRVAEVHGPYIIEEEDGFETIRHRDTPRSRTPVKYVV